MTLFWFQKKKKKKKKDKTIKRINDVSIKSIGSVRLTEEKNNHLYRLSNRNKSVESVSCR